MEIKLDKLLKVDEQSITHEGVRINAWIAKRKKYNKSRGEWEEIDEGIECTIKSKYSTRGLLRLGEANDGSKFVAVPHAINQAKSFINTCKENNYGTY